MNKAQLELYLTVPFYFQFKAERKKRMSIEQKQNEMLQALEKAIKSGNHDYDLCSAIKKRIIETKETCNVAPSMEEPYRYAYARKPEDRENCKRRTRTKLARIVRKELNINFKDHEMAKLQDFLNMELWGKLEYSVNEYEGDDVVDAYMDSHSYAPSCMNEKGIDSRSILQVYADNPDKIKLLVVNQRARALLWKLDGGNYFLDRIYPQNYGVAGEAMISHAKEKYNAIIRAEIFGNGLSNCDNTNRNFTVTITNNNDEWPYMDTFSYGDDCEGRVVLSNKPFAGMYFTFKETDGGREPESGEICPICNERCDELPFTDTEGESICEYCFDMHFTICERCNETVEQEMIRVVENTSLCDWCYNELFLDCHGCGEDYKKEDMKEGPDGHDYCDYCYEKLFTECTSCGDMKEYNEMFMIDDEYFCASCKEELFRICYVCNDYVDVKEMKQFNDGTVLCTNCTPLFSQTKEPLGQIKIA